MRQMKASNRRREDHSLDEPVVARVNVPGGIVLAGFTGALEGLLVYAILINLDRAEVLSVNPRPGFMISAGIAWRFWRTVDNFLKR